MNYLRKSRFLKNLSLCLAFNMLLQVVAPIRVYALADAEQVDFAGFEPVGATDMVNLFNGDFNYSLPVLSIPGPDGGGYAMSLSYHSGVRPEDDASWVGYGWSLNPGILSRNKVGYADDFNGVKVETFNKNRPNWTVGAVVDFALEYQSVDKEKDDPGNKRLVKLAGKGGEKKQEKEPKNALGNNNISISLSKSARLNNYRGFHSSYGFGAGYGGFASVNTNFSRLGVTFDLSINFEKAIASYKKNKKQGDDEKKQAGTSKEKTLAGKIIGLAGRFSAKKNFSTYSVSSFTAPDIPFDVESYAGIIYKRSMSLQASFSKNMGMELGHSGSFNYQLPFFHKEQKAYGYLHNKKYGDITENKTNLEGDVHYGDILGDYSLERETSVSKLDKYLGIPYATPDQFMTTGEVAMGGFKARAKSPGHFYPAPVQSRQKITSGGLEVGVSVDHVSIGFDIDLGKQVSTLRPWETIGDREFDGETYFRFNNDPAGELRYSNTYANAGKYVESAELNWNFIGLGMKQSKPKVADLNMKKDGFEAERQSIIRYHTFEDQENYDKNARSVAFVSDIKARYSAIGAESKLIREFQVTTPDNRTVTYGIPVMSSNETSLAIGIPDPSPSDIDNNYIIYKDDVKMDEDILLNQYVSGTRIAHPYASAFLMTNITNGNYVDLGGDGPSDDDFGGWTRFDYRRWQRASLESGDPYKYNYRTPYKGYLYSQNGISLSRDDQGTVLRGQKEIFYLKGVETRTHYAFFVTNKTKIEDYDELAFVSALSEDERAKLKVFLDGSGKTRLDGLGAPDLVDKKDPAGSRAYSTAGNTQELEYLEKIVLIAKDRPVKPMEITYFSYDYSLCPGIPNARSEDGKPTGKLTLKKVWTEHEGVTRSRIAPYVFDYSYPADLASRLRPELKRKYEAITEDLKKAGTENPAYAPEQLDAWGNYRDRGAQLARDRFEWTPQDPSVAFDPAAWNLKRIHLPSGGAIIVQYEQNDYAYVQDKRASVMAPLLRIGSNDVGEKDDDEDWANRYVVDVDRIGLLDNVEGAAREALLEDYAKYLEDYFGNARGPKEYVYFKFLYGMEGPAGLDTRSEYITGYTTARSVKVDQGKLYLTLGDREEWDKDRKLAKRDVWILPKDVCYHEYVTTRSRMYDADMEKMIETIDNDIWDAIDSDDVDELKENYKLVLDKDKKEKRKKIRKTLRTEGFEKLTPKVFTSVKGRDKVCQSLDYERSFFRLPVWEKKLGGGCRVKRLLMYDPGLDTDDQGLYGTEYHYTSEDGSTSGVATMEPPAGREENPLVALLERGNQSIFRRAVFGNERVQLEGPIGESVYPAASVGYERVVVQNIQKGPTGTGYQVHEFHTCREHPFEALEPTKMDKKNRVRDWMNLPLGLINIDVRKLWVSQGYAMVVNQMHGVKKRQATYRGEYAPGLEKTSGEGNQAGADKKSGHLVSSVEYEYFDFGQGESLDVLETSAARAKKNKVVLKTSKRVPGLEEDVAMYGKEIVNKTMDLSLEVDFAVDWQMAPAITVYLASIGVSLGYEHNTTGTHVVNKVMTLPATVRKVTSYSQGVKTVTENKIFDKYSGKPLVTVTYDLYDQTRFTSGARHQGAYWSYTIPAYLIYPGMENKSKDPAATHQIMDVAGSFTTYGENPDDAHSIIARILSGTFDLSTSPMQGVVSASAGVFENNWFETQKASSALLDEYLAKSGDLSGEDKEKVRGELNKLYHPVTSYGFGGERLRQASSDQGLIFRDGPAGEIRFFDWRSDDLKAENGRYATRAGDDWLRGPQVTKMSPQGYPVEEKDALDIPSATRFGYRGNVLPVISARNASYESVFFKDFEYETDEKLKNVIDKSGLHAHSGRAALVLSGFAGGEIVSAASDGMKVTSQLRSKGLLVSMWVKAETRNNTLVELREDELKARVHGSAAAAPFKRIARAGRWDLMEARVDLSKAAEGTALYLKVDCGAEQGLVVYADDIRMQPVDSEVSCSVYDVASLRLLTRFNDQHFGVYYVYDNEARLQRKVIETERGAKTIQEQVINQKRISRHE